MSGIGNTGLLAALDLGAMQALLQCFGGTASKVRLVGLHENRRRPSSVFVDVYLAWVSIDAQIVTAPDGVPERIDVRLGPLAAGIVAAFGCLVMAAILLALVRGALFAGALSLGVPLFLLARDFVILRRPVPGANVMRRAGLALRDGSPVLGVAREDGRAVLLVGIDFRGAPDPLTAPAKSGLTADSNLAVAVDDSLVPLLLEAAEKLGLPVGAGELSGTMQAWLAKWSAPTGGVHFQLDPGSLRFTARGIHLSAAADGELDGMGVTARAQASGSGVASLSVQTLSPPILNVSADATVEVEAELSGLLVWIGTVLAGPLLPVGSLAAVWWLALKFLPFRQQGSLSSGLATYQVVVAPQSPLQGIPPYDARGSFQVSASLDCDIQMGLQRVGALQPYLSLLEFGADSVEMADHVLTVRAGVRA